MAFDGDLAIAPRQRVSRLQLPDAAEDRSRRERRPEREDVVEAERIDRPRDTRVSKERLDLGGEQELVTALRVEQRANAEAVAREEQRARVRIPDRERPLAVELANSIGAELFVQMQNDFGIG